MRPQGGWVETLRRGPGFWGCDRRDTRGSRHDGIGCSNVLTEAAGRAADTDDFGVRDDASEAAAALGVLFLQEELSRQLGSQPHPPRVLQNARSRGRELHP